MICLPVLIEVFEPKELIVHKAENVVHNVENVVHNAENAQSSATLSHIGP